MNTKVQKHKKRTTFARKGNRDSRLWVRLVTWVKRKKPEAKKAPHIKKDSKPLANTKPMRAPTRPTPDSSARDMPALVLRKVGSQVRPKRGILLKICGPSETAEWMIDG